MEERMLMNDVNTKTQVAAAAKAVFQRLQSSFQNYKDIAFHYSFVYAQQVH